MHPRIAELLGYLDQQRTELRGLLDGIPHGIANQRPTAGGWSIVSVVEHLALVEKRIAALLQKKIGDARAAGLGAETESSPIMPTFNVTGIRDRSMRIEAPENLRPGTIQDMPAAIDALETSRSLFRDVILDADGLALGQVVHPHPGFGPLNGYQWIAFIGAHEARHTDQIRETAGSLSGAR